MDFEQRSLSNKKTGMKVMAHLLPMVRTGVMAAEAQYDKEDVTHDVKTFEVAGSCVRFEMQLYRYQKHPPLSIQPRWTTNGSCRSEQSTFPLNTMPVKVNV